MDPERWADLVGELGYRKTKGHRFQPSGPSPLRSGDPRMASAAYYTRPLPAILTVSPTTRTISSHAFLTMPLSEPATCSRRRTRSALLAETAAAAVAAVIPIPRSLMPSACRRRRRMRSASETSGTSTNRRKNVTSFGRVRYGVSAPRISA